MNNFEKMISAVVIDYIPCSGYTTCMWHNLINSKIVYDKNGKLQELQAKYKIPYPKKLKENIISNNIKLLNGMLPSFDMQIEKAENRGDLVSVNHRVTEFLASYFDIIFALNEMTASGKYECKVFVLKNVVFCRIILMKILTDYLKECLERIYHL